MALGVQLEQTKGLEADLTGFIGEWKAAGVSDKYMIAQLQNFSH